MPHNLGEGDKLISPKYSEKFSKCIKNSTLEIIKDAKHTPHYSNPEEVARLLLNFI